MANEDSSGTPLIGRLETVTAVAIVGLLGLLLGVAALLMPATKSVSRALTYQQVGSFTYSGAAPVKSIYGGEVKNGQPISVSVVKALTVLFNYQLKSTRPVVGASGTASMVANVNLGEGLSRRFAMGSSTKITGTTANLKGVLPIQAIVHYITTSQAAIPGLQNIPASVSIAPNVKLAGELGGRPLAATFTHPLGFTLLSGTLEISNQSTTAPTSSTSSSAAAQALTSTKAGSVKFQGAATNVVPLLVGHLRVNLAREIGFGLAGLCLLLGLFLGRPLRGGAGRQNNRDRVRAMYGSLLVPVREFSTPEGPVAEVASMGALAELAKRYEAMILHRRREDGDEYMVWDNGMLYRHTVIGLESRSDVPVILPPAIDLKDPSDVEVPPAPPVVSKNAPTATGRLRRPSVRPTKEHHGRRHASV